MLDDSNISVCTLLIWIAAGVSLAMAICIGVGLLEPRWAPMFGFFVACAHGLAIRRWLANIKERETVAFELGRESVRSIR